MKTLLRGIGLIFVIVLTFSLVGPTSAANTWAVGNLVGLCAGTQIHTGSGDSYPVHTIVPENNWTVKVINGPRSVDGATWWDTSRKAAGDPSGGTGWVKQNEADGCLNGGGSNEGGGGDTGGTVDHLYSSTAQGDEISDAEPIDGAPEPASDGFQWPFSTDRNAGTNATGFAFKAVDTYCDGTTNGRHAAIDWDAGHGNPIYAIGKGKVIAVRWNESSANRGYGLYIVIWHKAPNGADIYSLYAHLQSGTALVKVGQPVNRGDKIARQDTSGGANGASHLHFEIRKAPYDITVSACPTSTEDVSAIDNHFHNPATYIGGDYWWENYGSPRTPSPETLQQDASALANLLGTQTYLEQGVIDQGQISSPKSFWVSVQDLFIMVYHKIFGSATQLSLYKPDGTLYGTYLLDGPNAMEIIVPNPEPGQWSYTVRGVDIPYENYPYAVSVGARTEPFLNLSDTPGDDPFGTLDGDLVAPTTTVTVDPSVPNGNNGWYKTPVEISFSAVDNPGGVGVAETRYVINNNHVYLKYTDPFTFALEGENSLGYYSVDGMGNGEALQTAQINIDLTPPVVTVSTDRTEYTRVQPFVVHYSGYDPEPGSGLMSLNGAFNQQSVTDGQSVDMFWWSLSQYTLNVTGEDYAGWTTMESKSIQLIATIESLQQTVQRLCQEQYITKSGVCNSLLSKLDSALAAQKRGQNKTAVNILLALQNEIRAQTGKAIKPEASSILIMDSNYVIQRLGGK